MSAGQDSADAAESSGSTSEPGSGGKRVLGNTALLTGSRLVVAAIQWFTTLLIIRNLSVDDFGSFSLIFSILGMLSIITDMGLGRIAVTMLMEDRPGRDRIAGAFIVLRTLLGVLGYLVAVAVVALGGYGSDVTLAAVVGSVSVIFATISSAHGVLFQVAEQMKTPALSTIIGALAQMLAVLMLIVRDASLVAFMIPAVLAAAVEGSIRIVRARSLMPVTYCVDLPLWRRVLREAIPISVGNAMSTLYYKVDTIMLAQLSTMAAVATYSVAYKFVDIVNMIPWAVTTAALPALVRHWPDDLPGFRKLALHVTRLMTAVAVLIAVGFLVVADYVVPLLYGAEYSSAATPAKIVVGSQCLSFLAAAALLLLIASGHHRYYPWIATAGLVANVGLNLWAIPRYSYNGAATVTLLTDLVVAILMWFEVNRVGVLPLRKLLSLWRVFGCGLVTLAVCLYLEAYLWWPLVGLLVVVIFVALLELTRALGPGSLRDQLRLA